MLSFFLKVLLLFLLVLMSVTLFNDGGLLQCTHIFFYILSAGGGVVICGH